MDRSRFGRAGLLSLSLIMSLVTADLVAADLDKESKNPLGCRDVGYRFDLKTLQFLPGTASPNLQSMYFVYNTAPELVNLYQMRTEAGMRNLYLNHAIQPYRWSVLSTNEKSLKYICTQKDARYRYGHIIDCHTALKICQFTNVKYGMNNRGNYWLIGNASKGEAIGAVIRYGIIPAV